MRIFPVAVLFAFIGVFFVSCNSGSKVASSFGKRKYTKGHYSYACSGERNVFVPAKISMVHPLDNISYSKPARAEENNSVVVCQTKGSYIPVLKNSSWYTGLLNTTPLIVELPDTETYSKRAAAELKKYRKTAQLELTGFALILALLGIKTKFAVFFIAAALSIVAALLFKYFRKKPHSQIIRPNADMGRSYVPENQPVNQDDIHSETTTKSFFIAAFLLLLLGIGLTSLVALYGLASSGFYWLAAIIVFGLGLWSCIKAGAAAQRRHKGLGLLTFAIIFCLFSYLLIFLA